ncbi:MAG: C_GCAxxG_C_C family protein [bacterium]|nr:C_GCAxxG_C_C family protein [bacterium]
MKTELNYKKELSVSCFKKGYCCSQAAFFPFAEQLGLDRDTALKIADSFGGGMSLGSVCGAVTGAMMAIGLKYGRADAEDAVAKENTRSRVKGLIKRFKERNGSLNCRDLLGYDIAIPADHDKAEAEGLFDNCCPKYIEDAVEILEDLL